MTGPVSLCTALPAIIGMGTMRRTMAASCGQHVDPNDRGFGSKCVPIEAVLRANERVRGRAQAAWLDGE